MKGEAADGVAPQPTLPIFQTPPLPEGVQGKYMTATQKRRYRVTPIFPQMTTISEEIVEYIARDKQLMRDLLLDDFK